jgi:hypothetical protein
MASARKVAASQANGRKSRGPKTVAGKARSSRNAWRHGLSSVEQGHHQHVREIEEIAKRLSGGADGDPEIYQAAITFAQSEFLWRCVQTERLAAVERLRDVRSAAIAKSDKGLALGKARAQQAELAYAELLKMDPALPDKGLNQFWFEMATQKPDHREAENLQALRPLAELCPDERDEVEALAEAMPYLRRLARYERRAWSRRNRNFQAFLDVKFGGRAGCGLAPAIPRNSIYQ